MSERTEALESLLAPTVEALGCRIWGIERVGRPTHPTLRIYIDREEGITIDDCERVSRQVSVVLDVEEALPGSYTLEVSSPGLDRVLFRPEHYAESIGETVEVRLFAPLAGRRRITGRLEGLLAETITVEENEAGERVEIPLAAIARAQIVPQFD